MRRVGAMFPRAVPALVLAGSGLAGPPGSPGSRRRCAGRTGLGGLGFGPGFREVAEKLAADAARPGANAPSDWKREGATLAAKAVTISVNPSTRI